MIPPYNIEDELKRMTPYDEGFDEAVAHLANNCVGHPKSPYPVEEHDNLWWLQGYEDCIHHETTCQHATTTRGKDAPMRYGTYRTAVCTACGAFRVHGHTVEPTGGWLPASEYEARTREEDDDG